MSEANEWKKEDEAVTATLVAHATATPSPPPTFIEEMKEMFLMFLGLGFSLIVMLKLVHDQGINFPWTLASLFAICNMICRPGGLVSAKTPDRQLDFCPGHKESQTCGVYV